MRSQETHAQRSRSTHVGVVARLDGVVALQLAPGPVGLALRAPQVAHAVVIGDLHGLSRWSALHVLRF